MNKSLILNEIKKHMKFKTDTELANFLGVKQNTISTWKARDTIDYDLIISKCDFLDANWLLTGKGEMLKSDGPAPDRQKEIDRLLELLDQKDLEIKRLKKDLKDNDVGFVAKPKLKQEK